MSQGGSLNVNDTFISIEMSTGDYSNNIDSTTVTNNENINSSMNLNEKLSKSMIKDKEYILIIPQCPNQKLLPKSLFPVLSMTSLILLVLFLSLAIIQKSDNIYGRPLIIIFNFIVLMLSTINIIYRRHEFYHQVLKINGKQITFNSKMMFMVVNEIENKGLGITLKRVKFDTKDFMNLEIIEEKAKMIDEDSGVIEERIYASFRIMYKNGSFSIGKFLSPNEAQIIKKDICEFALKDCQLDLRIDV